MRGMVIVFLLSVRVLIDTVWLHYNTSASDFTSIVLIRTLPGALVLPQRRLEAGN